MATIRNFVSHEVAFRGEIEVTYLVDSRNQSMRLLTAACRVLQDSQQSSHL